MLLLLKIKNIITKRSYKIDIEIEILRLIFYHNWPQIT